MRIAMKPIQSRLTSSIPRRAAIVLLFVVLGLSPALNAQSMPDLGTMMPPPAPPPSACGAATALCQGNCLQAFTQCVANAGNVVTTDCQTQRDDCNTGCATQNGAC